MAFLIAQLAWPLILLALAGGAAGWCWHCMRTADQYAARERARTDARAALFAFYGNQPLLTGQADVDARLAALERDLVEAQRRASDFAALAEERDQRLVELRGALVEADAMRARAAELEAALAAAPTPFDPSPLHARIAELEAQASRASEPAAAAPPADPLRTRYLESRLAWAEGRLIAAEHPRADGALAAAQKEIADLRGQLADLTLRTEVSEADDERNQLRWRNRYLQGRVNFLEANAVATPPPSAQVVIDPEAEARSKWRSRYMASRVAYLEQREKELSAPQPPAVNVAEIKALKAEIVRIRTAYGQLQSQAQAAMQVAQERQGRIAALERDLNAALEMAAEADALRVKMKALEEAQASAIDPADMTRLRWRARYQEARVRYLESRLGELAAQPKPEPAAVAAPAPPEPQPAPQPLVAAPPRLREPAPLPAEPRFVWRRVRVIDEPAMSSARERAAWRRRDDPPVARAPQPLAAPEPVPQPRIPRAAPASMPTIADRPPGLPGPRGGAPDDLRMIAGIGPKIESTLHSLGIYHFDQIAGWNAAQVSWIDQYLTFRGRVTREGWIEQAAALARGEDTEGKKRYLQGEHV